MGYLETAVVVYIRKHYYPNGFDFPLLPIGKDIAITEFFREIATIIMLAGIGILVGENRLQRFAFFIYCFAIWDIFYYVFLYVLLGWPKSLLTFDVLFLIPVPWISPVICPCLISALLIFYAMIVVWNPAKINLKMRSIERLILFAGCALVLYSFVADYITFVLAHHSDKGVWTFSQRKDLFSEAEGFIPQSFRWEIFIPGFMLMSGAISIFGLRIKNTLKEFHAEEWKQVV
ncbi:MAG: hypothetical protein HY064_06225 [Bacteroidetes bacterium]|nr:hypothetical protein [Bacteroidota bacterium]